MQILHRGYAPGPRSKLGRDRTGVVLLVEGMTTVWRQSHQRGPLAEPLVGGSEGASTRPSSLLSESIRPT